MKRRQESFVLQAYGVIKFSLLQRRPDPYWTVRFRGQDGRRLERSTGKTKRGEALEVAPAVILKAYKPEGETTAAPFTNLDHLHEDVHPPVIRENVRPFPA